MEANENTELTMSSLLVAFVMSNRFVKKEKKKKRKTRRNCVWGVTGLLFLFSLLVGEGIIRQLIFSEEE